MKKTFCALLLLAAFNANAQEAKTPKSMVTVNGQPITELDFLLFREQSGQGDTPVTPQAQAQVLNALINTTILAQEAEKRGLDKETGIASALEISRNRVLAEAIMASISNEEIAEEALKAAYDEKYSTPTKEFKARHILLETEEAAKAVIKELEAGGDFAELAKTKSTGPSGKDGGDLGWFNPKTMVPPFAEAVKTMETGKFSAQPVKTQFGWHVILLENTREIPVPNFESSKSKIKHELVQKQQREVMRALRKAAKIDVQLPEDGAKKSTEK